jgi:hypothetical protein
LVLDSQTEEIIKAARQMNFTNLTIYPDPNFINYNFDDGDVDAPGVFDME